MSKKLSRIALAAAAAFALVTPAFAQSFSNSMGTGNVLPSYYGADGGLHRGQIGAQAPQFAGQGNGLNAYAKIPHGAVHHRR